MVAGKVDFMKRIGQAPASSPSPQRVGGGHNVAPQKNLMERIQAFDNKDSNVYDRINSMGDGELHPASKRKFDMYF